MHERLHALVKRLDLRVFLAALFIVVAALGLRSFSVARTSPAAMSSTPVLVNILDRQPLNLSDSLFPLTSVRSGWSTCGDQTPVPDNISRYPLSDASLRSTKIAHSTLRHTVVDAPPGLPGTSMAFRADYPAGSVNPGGPVKGGFSFYAPGPQEANLVQAMEVVFSYAVFFQEDFDFNLGGKMPGLYGGASPEQAYACSGGRQDDRDNCFSLRLMWRRAGAGELYAYLPTSPANDALCTVPPKSVCNNDYGTSVGRGSWSFEPGEWAVVAQRVRLNGPGVANGELEVFVNGSSVLAASGIVLRNSSDSVFRGAHMQTFFGGSGQSWASPKSQSAYFSAFTLSIFE